MIVRNYSSQNDYKDICTWWKEQSFPILSENFLSPYGFIAEDNGTKVACIFVYPTPSCMFYMECAIGNPDVTWEKRKEGLGLVADSGCQWAKNNGATVISTIVKKQRLHEKMNDFNFIKVEEDLVQYMRSL